jgi:hypothetical protein
MNLMDMEQDSILVCPTMSHVVPSDQEDEEDPGKSSGVIKKAMERARKKLKKKKSGKQEEAEEEREGTEDEEEDDKEIRRFLREEMRRLKISDENQDSFQQRPRVPQPLPDPTQPAQWSLFQPRHDTSKHNYDQDVPYNDPMEILIKGPQGEQALFSVEEDGNVCLDTVKSVFPEATTIQFKRRDGPAPSTVRRHGKWLLRPSVGWDAKITYIAVCPTAGISQASTPSLAAPPVSERSFIRLPALNADLVAWSGHFAELQQFIERIVAVTAGRADVERLVYLKSATPTDRRHLIQHCQSFQGAIDQLSGVAINPSSLLHSVKLQILAIAPTGTAAGEKQAVIKLLDLLNRAMALEADWHLEVDTCQIAISCFTRPSTQDRLYSSLVGEERRRQEANVPVERSYAGAFRKMLQSLHSEILKRENTAEAHGLLQPSSKGQSHGMSVPVEVLSTKVQRELHTCPLCSTTNHGISLYTCALICNFKGKPEKIKELGHCTLCLCPIGDDCSTKRCKSYKNQKTGRLTYRTCYNHPELNKSICPCAPAPSTAPGGSGGGRGARGGGQRGGRGGSRQAKPPAKTPAKIAQDAGTSIQEQIEALQLIQLQQLRGQPGATPAAPAAPTAPVGPASPAAPAAPAASTTVQQLQTAVGTALPSATSTVLSLRLNGAVAGEALCPVEVAELRGPNGATTKVKILTDNHSQISILGEESRHLCHNIRWSQSKLSLETVSGQSQPRFVEVGTVQIQLFDGTTAEVECIIHQHPKTRQRKTPLPTELQALKAIGGMVLELGDPGAENVHHSLLLGAEVMASLHPTAERRVDGTLWKYGQMLVMRSQISNKLMACGVYTSSDQEVHINSTDIINDEGIDYDYNDPNYNEDIAWASCLKIQIRETSSFLHDILCNTEEREGCEATTNSSFLLNPTHPKIWSSPKGIKENPEESYSCEATGPSSRISEISATAPVSVTEGNSSCETTVPSSQNSSCKTTVPSSRISTCEATIPASVTAPSTIPLQANVPVSGQSLLMKPEAKVLATLMWPEEDKTAQPKPDMPNAKEEVVNVEASPPSTGEAPEVPLRPPDPLTYRVQPTRAIPTLEEGLPNNKQDKLQVLKFVKEEIEASPYPPGQCFKCCDIVKSLSSETRENDRKIRSSIKWTSVQTKPSGETPPWTCNLNHWDPAAPHLPFLPSRPHGIMSATRLTKEAIVTHDYFSEARASTMRALKTLEGKEHCTAEINYKLAKDHSDKTLMKLDKYLETEAVKEAGITWSNHKKHLMFSGVSIAMNIGSGNSKTRLCADPSIRSRVSGTRVNETLASPLPHIPSLRRHCLDMVLNPIIAFADLQNFYCRVAVGPKGALASTFLLMTDDKGLPHLDPSKPAELQPWVSTKYRYGFVDAGGSTILARKAAIQSYKDNYPENDPSYPKIPDNFLDEVQDHLDKAYIDDTSFPVTLSQINEEMMKPTSPHPQSLLSEDHWEELGQRILERKLRVATSALDYCGFQFKNILTYDSHLTLKMNTDPRLTDNTKDAVPKQRPPSTLLNQEIGFTVNKKRGRRVPAQPSNLLPAEGEASDGAEQVEGPARPEVEAPRRSQPNNVLGMCLDPNTDRLAIKQKPLNCTKRFMGAKSAAADFHNISDFDRFIEQNGMLTKAECLSFVNGSYNLLANFNLMYNLVAKLMFREVIKDKNPAEQIKQTWRQPVEIKFLKSYRELTQLYFLTKTLSSPRYALIKCPLSRLRVDVVCMGDGTPSVATAVVYLVSWDKDLPDEKMISLVLSANKISPLRGLTTPHNELQAYLIGTGLVFELLQALHSNKIPVRRVKIISDSVGTVASLFTYAGSHKAPFASMIAQVQVRCASMEQFSNITETPSLLNTCHYIDQKREVSHQGKTYQAINYSDLATRVDVFQESAQQWHDKMLTIRAGAWLHLPDEVQSTFLSTDPAALRRRPVQLTSSLLPQFLSTDPDSPVNVMSTSALGTAPARATKPSPPSHPKAVTSSPSDLLSSHIRQDWSFLQQITAHYRSRTFKTVIKIFGAVLYTARRWRDTSAQRRAQRGAGEPALQPSRPSYAELGYEEMKEQCQKESVWLMAGVCGVPKAIQLRPRLQNYYLMAIKTPPFGLTTHIAVGRQTREQFWRPTTEFCPEEGVNHVVRLVHSAQACPLRELLLHTTHRATGCLHSPTTYTETLIASGWLWVGAEGDFDQLSKNCPGCIRKRVLFRKIAEQPYIPGPDHTSRLASADNVVDFLQIDQFGPMDYNYSIEGPAAKCYILMCTETATKRTYLIPIRSCSAQDVVAGLYQLQARRGGLSNLVLDPLPAHTVLANQSSAVIEDSDGGGQPRLSPDIYGLLNDASIQDKLKKINIQVHISPGNTHNQLGIVENCAKRIKRLLFDYFRNEKVPDIWELTFRVSLLENLCNKRLLFISDGNIVTPLTLAQSCAAVSRFPNVDLLEITHPKTAKVNSVIDQSKTVVKKIMRFYINFYVKTLLQNSYQKFKQIRIMCNDVVIVSDLVIHHVYSSLRKSVGRIVSVSTDHRAYKIKMTTGSIITRPAKFIILIAKHDLNEKVTYIDPFENISSEKIISDPIIDFQPNFYDSCDIRLPDISDVKFPENCKCNEVEKEKEVEKETGKEGERDLEQPITHQETTPPELRRSSRRAKTVDHGAVIQH